jgi:thioredoxin 1
MNKLFYSIGFASIALFFLAACSGISVSLSTDVFEKRMNEPEALLVDVRTAEEFRQGHLKDAVNIDFYSSSFEEQLSELDKNKTLLLYCRSGNRSGKSIDMARKNGFAKVYDLNGGILAWTADSKPIEN